MEPLKIKIKKTHPEAQIPLITQGNACFDFYAVCGGIFIGALVLVDLTTSISLVNLLTR